MQNTRHYFLNFLLLCVIVDVFHLTKMRGICVQLHILSQSLNRTRCNNLCTIVSKILNKASGVKLYIIINHGKLV